MTISYSTIEKIGKYQMILAFIVILNSPLTMIMNISFPFMTKKPNLLCKPIDSIFDFQYCHEEEYCKFSELEYAKTKENNLINMSFDYDLYCDKAYLTALMGTLFFFGGILGSLFLSPLPDKYGREKIYKILMLTNFLLNANILFSINFWHILIANFFLGISSFLFSMSTLIITENFDIKSAGIVQTINQTIFPVTGILVGIFFLVVNNWKILFFIICLLNFIGLIVCYKFMLESPRWLNSQNRILEAKNILDQITIINGNISEIHHCKTSNDINIPNQSNCTDTNQTSKKTLSLIEIFKLKSQQTTLLVLTYVWFGAGFCFYGLILNLEKLGGNIFIDSFFTFTGEIVSQTLCGYLANKIGRVFVLRTTGFLGGLGFILYSCVSNPLLKSIFIFMTSFGFSATFSAIYIYTPEIFPTSIRSTTIGFLNFVSRMGALIVPSVSALIPRIQLFFGVLGILSSFLCLNLKETIGKEIEDEVPEVRSQNFLINKKINNNTPSNIIDQS